MEDYNFYNITHYDDYSSFDHEQARFIVRVVTWIIIGVGLPLSLVAIYTSYLLVRKDGVTPIYVINLLISDLIQLCSMIVFVTDFHWGITTILIRTYILGLMVSVGFMVCVALKRYLVVTSPLCSCFRQTTKICVVVWVVPLFCVVCMELFIILEIHMIFAILLLLPFPLLIFFLGGTIKALPAASHVPPDEKRRIVAVLVLMLLVYTLLYLPSIIWTLAGLDYYHNLNYVFLTIPRFSPLADMFLYVFLRKGAVDKLLATLCCCRMESNDISRVDDDHMYSVSSM